MSGLLTSVLVSTEGGPSEFCDGERMDSDGYRKTLTTEKPVRVSSEATQLEQIKLVLATATTEGMCRQVMQQLDVTVAEGVAHIPPIDGWAGVSITMCGCRPEVETNLVRVPGVMRVVWDKDNASVER